MDYAKQLEDKDEYSGKSELKTLTHTHKIKRQTFWPHY